MLCQNDPLALHKRPVAQSEPVVQPEHANAKTDPVVSTDRKEWGHRQPRQACQPEGEATCGHHPSPQGRDEARTPLPPTFQQSRFCSDACSSRVKTQQCHADAWVPPKGGWLRSKEGSSKHQLLCPPVPKISATLQEDLKSEE